MPASPRTAFATGDTPTDLSPRLTSTPTTEHEHIEAEEDARERDFEGLPTDAPLTADRVVVDPLDSHAHGSQDDQAPGAQDAGAAAEGQAVLRRPAGSNAGKPARIERTRPSSEDLSRLAKEAREQGTWGEKDMHRPRNDRERMRKGTPYSQSVEVVFGCRETDRVAFPRSSRIQDGPEQRVLIGASHCHPCIT